jgi:adenylate cyclase class 2
VVLEAEVKLRLDAAARARLLARLEAAGARLLGEVRQVDEYFAHPVRDFASTDEALRLREYGGAVRITYKGPKLDPPRKTREEIELPFGSDRESAARLLDRLGFTAVARVTKLRRELRLADPPPTLVCLDEVEGLGSFCEVEVEAESVAAGRERLAARLAELGLDALPAIPESYLEMLLALRA